jgi:hypothetical protein
MDKQGVLEHLAEARAALLAAIGGLAEADMTALPVAGEWTIKDILAHVSGWAAWDLAGVEGVLAGEPPDFSAIQDVDTFNARLVAERREWTLGRVLVEMADTHVALQGLCASMPGEAVFRAGPFQGPYWDSLAGWLQVAWEHEEEHATQIRAWRQVTRK